MTMMKTCYILLSLSLLLSAAESFSPVAMQTRRMTQALRSTLVHDHEEETNYRYLFAKAKEIAYSDASTRAEALSYMNKILEFESDCVSGALVGQPMCQNVEEVADIVAHLREKIENSSQIAVRYVWALRAK